ncbi:hypothetical protein [Bradyrhizobium sp. 930_D9_N1_4]|uniref:hypothetical protein n=1 Tax=Bradyrhizobium sp. 930_D9_N1_4 TaxID=3240374 RepID=UPI003F899938
MFYGDKCWFERAAEIKVQPLDKSPRRGSGYMIAPGVVLTALHVVAGDGPLPPNPVTCRIRILGDISKFGPEAAPFCDAEVKWPAPGASIDNAGDAALVVVNEQQWTDSMRECAALPVLDSRAARDVVGIGMPALARMIDPNSAGFQDFSGRIANRLERTSLLKLTLDNQKYPNPDEWKGASGAVLLDAKAEALVGILVHADHRGYEDVRSDISRPLMLETLADFAKTKEFQSVITLDRVTDAHVSSTEIPRELFGQARDVLHQLDRVNQIRQIGRVLKGATAATYRPIVLVSRMKEQDCPDIFVRTVSDHLMEKFKDRRQCYWKPSDLSWAQDFQPQRAVVILKRDIMGDVSAADETEFDKALADGQAKRFFAVRIASEDVESPTLDTLKDLFVWWFARANCEGGPAVLLLRIVDRRGDGEECQKAKAVYQLAGSLFSGPAPFDDFEQILQPLSRCTLKELEDWAEARLKARLGPHWDPLSKRFRERVGSGDTFRLRIIHEALN